MNFRHVPKINWPTLVQETLEHGRWYVTDEGNRYPSVTTVISKGTDTSWLERWKSRVGEEEAKRISKQATRRGSAVHDIAEKYLSNDPNYKKGQTYVNIETFQSIKPHLDKNITLIAGLEKALYSDKLQCAGTVDCIAKWNGVWSIVDFKTSKREKSKEDVFNYMCQEACYAFFFYERFGKVIPQIVTVMAVDDANPIIFIEKTRNYLEEFIKIRKAVDI